MSGFDATIPIPELPSGPRSALVVGTTAYQDPALPPLQSPAVDVRELTSVLADPRIGGFRVKSLDDPPVQELRERLENFLHDREPQELVLVYLSGHGVRDLRGRLFYAAKDTRKNRLASTGVEDEWLRRLLQECRSRQKVLILDCCFSGAFISGAKAGVDELPLGLGAADAGRGLAILTASRAGEYAFEGDSSAAVDDGSALPSVFTAGLVHGLATGAADTDHDGLVSVDDAYEHARGHVQDRNGEQNPQRSLISGEGRIWLARNPFGGRGASTLPPERARIGLQPSGPGTWVQPPPAPGPGIAVAARADGPQSPLDLAADRLAAAMSLQRTKTATQRLLYSPAPIPVRWRRSVARGVAVPIAAALGDARRATRFEPLPGVTAADATSSAAGGIPELFAVYAGLRSGRVIVLGGPGRGKSDTATLTVLEALKHRAALDVADRVRVPVPVLLSVEGWDPARQRLSDWLAVRLAADHRFLRSNVYGRDAAVRLVEEGRIALFLDGFDELTLGLRTAVLHQIDQHATHRVMIFSRTEYYAETVRACGPLNGAAALELLPVSGDDAAAFLAHCQVEPAPEPWHRLIVHLGAEPDGPLANALDSPLTLTLVRDGFRQDPAGVQELLEPGRFATRDEIVAHLLDRLVDITYRDVSGKVPSTDQPEPARRWLCYLAAGLDDRRSSALDWRLLHQWAPRLPRIAAFGALGMLAAALCGVALFNPAVHYRVHGRNDLAFGVPYLGLLGLLFGLAAGAVNEFRASSERRFTPSGETRPRRTNPTIGLVVGLAVTPTVANLSNYWFGLLAGLAAGGTAAVTAVPVRGLPNGTGWWASLRVRFALVAGGAAGLPVGLAFWYERSLADGLWAGCVSTLAIGLLVGATRPSPRARSLIDPATAWREDLRRAAVLAVGPGLCLGLAWGFDGNLDGLRLPAVVLGIALLVSLACMAAVSDSCRTTLVFLQLSRRGLLPARGMRFLAKAYRHRLLRAEGPVYQFRHALLQKKLAQEWRESLRLLPRQ
ncbi:caspase family protein [Actinoalloteichus sp. GBA129-24]|uniref:caspase family protein n=1 Tax=Actinoalloteichus sp. GBA129-24 TaxID=1612551 RepID=UPI0009508C02|nr:caspase family protein [Actinoalloteichus sp. GBA129-24]APU22264.1 Caspase domain-containing protein [Actinoalloteichus sp. GBA129-24]